MGKSPAKWVKNILGKRSSKSHPSKKAAEENMVPVPAQASSRELNATSTMSNSSPLNTTTEVNYEFKQPRSTSTTYENVIPVATHRVSSEVSAIGFKLSKEAENLGLEEAATEIQAALRGFMARQAYHSLKGVVRLQALVRGHLVRRQASATLHCVRGIVKLQAVLRGRRVRHSDIGLEVHKKCSFQEVDVIESTRFSSSIIQGKQSSNAFASKILGLSVSTLPLNLQYDQDEPNSARKWLERWSTSNFWGSTPHQKEALGSNSHRQGSNGPGARKLEVRRAASANVDNSLVCSSFENGKPKRNNRKPLSQHVESVRYHPENELERVKRNLRQISINNKDAPGKSEPAAEMPKESTRNVSLTPAPDARSKSESPTEALNQSAIHTSNSEILDAREQVFSDSIVDGINPSGTQPHMPEMGTKLESLVVYESVDLAYLSAVPSNGENGVDVGKFSLTNEEQAPKDEKSIDNDCKLRRRSVPTRQEYYENASQNTRTLPSYMAATESAKAKLRGLGSPKFAQEGEEDAVIRRHSLPSTSGKLPSMSPRMQKVVAHANGKDRIRSDRSLTTSKDGHGKVIRPEWRR